MGMEQVVVDFEKWLAISELEKLMPITIHSVVLRHPESDTLEIEASFFMKDDAEKACEWYWKHQNDECVEYDVKSHRLTKWKGEQESNKGEGDEQKTNG